MSGAARCQVQPGVRCSQVSGAARCQVDPGVWISPDLYGECAGLDAVVSLDRLLLPLVVRDVPRELEHRAPHAGVQEEVQLEVVEEVEVVTVKEEVEEHLVEVHQAEVGGVAVASSPPLPPVAAGPVILRCWGSGTLKLGEGITTVVSIVVTIVKAPIKAPRPEDF